MDRVYVIYDGVNEFSKIYGVADSLESALKLVGGESPKFFRDERDKSYIRTTKDKLFPDYKENGNFDGFITKSTIEDHYIEIRYLNSTDWRWY